MRSRSKPLMTHATLTLALILTMVLMGCNNRADKLQTINSSDSLFHVKAPSSWQQRVDDNFMGLYASDTLPTSEDLKSLSIVILSGRTVSTTASPELLAEFAKDRSVTRKWKGAKLGDPTKADIGGRSSSRVAVSGSDANGAFAGAYYLIRTSGSDVLVMAVAPADQWGESETSVTQLTKDWFWHEPATREASGTP